MSNLKFCSSFGDGWAAGGVVGGGRGVSEKLGLAKSLI